VFNTLADFNGTNGAEPSAPLIQGLDGNLYGTAFMGGHLDCPGRHGCGTIFKITPLGRMTAQGLDSEEGASPQAALLLASDGNYYGTTVGAGLYNSGTIFKMNPAGVITVLYDFCPDQNGCSDGSFPNALVQGIDGAFYGTTGHGGGGACSDGCGTVFKLAQDGSFNTLYRFKSTDGNIPMGRLVQGIDGNFYGETLEGASTYGTIFKITPSGTLTILHFFWGGDGRFPSGGLIEASDGNFYGTTEAGGPKNFGTLFRMTAAGNLATLHYFNRGTNEPCSALTEGSDGRLYGTTFYGGYMPCNPSNGCGIIYSLSSDGTFTVEHAFEGADGRFPTTGLIQATNGVFYGTAEEGGSNFGTIYSLDMGLRPFVAFVRNAGKIGSLSGILGEGFTGSTDVSFNGIPATFKVVSDTLIEATVPPGATTGYVTVTTPSGTLTSNKKFIVLP